MTDIKANLKRIEERIAEAASRVGRDPAEITLVAVSKFHGVDDVRAAYEAGQRDFGENYAQHMRDKADALAELPDIRWHFIGHLQRNKAKYVAPSAALLETVDSQKLVNELEKQAKKLGRILPCLVQVNVGGEEQKSGCDSSEAAALVQAVERADNLRLEGLMTIPPWDLDPDQTRVYFRALRALRDELGGPGRLPHLSMGMSHDFEEAVEEGATLVRVGTAVFGPRPDAQQ